MSRAVFAALATLGLGAAGAPARADDIVWVDDGEVGEPEADEDAQGVTSADMPDADELPSFRAWSIGAVWFHSSRGQASALRLEGSRISLAGELIGGIAAGGRLEPSRFVVQADARLMHSGPLAQLSDALALSFFGLAQVSLRGQTSAGIDGALSLAGGPSLTLGDSRRWSILLGPALAADLNDSSTSYYPVEQSTLVMPAGLARIYLLISDSVRLHAGALVGFDLLGESLASGAWSAFGGLDVAAAGLNLGLGVRSRAHFGELHGLRPVEHHELSARISW